MKFKSVLSELVKPFTHEVTVKAVEREKLIRRVYGSNFSAAPVSKSKKSSLNGNKSGKAQQYRIEGRPLYVSANGKDIYGNEKPTETRYFECLNCKRSIAGTRFAAHVERCFSGRNARSRGYEAAVEDDD